MVATNLTETGWENGSIGTWTNRKDLVKDLLEGIIVAEGVTANTRRGNDTIRGTVKVAGNETGKEGIDNNGTIITGPGKDTIRGTFKVAGNGIANDGIDNEGTNAIIDTGKGHDRIIGTVKVAGNGIANEGLDNDGKIDTGAGHDRIRGTFKVAGNATDNDGIDNNGTIIMGRGKDTIKGNVSVLGEGDLNNGIRNTSNSIIDTGYGNDTIHGKVAVGSGHDNFGIFNEGTIDTGKGHDRVTAKGPDPFSGFGGGGQIHLGYGHDKIIGFGEQIVDGGAGYDIAKFDFDLGDIVLSMFDFDIKITAINNGATMSFNNVEKFIFNDGKRSLSALQDMAEDIVAGPGLPGDQIPGPGDVIDFSGGPLDNGFNPDSEPVV